MLGNDVIIVVGGVSYSVPPMTFRTIKKVMPQIRAFSQSKDLVEVAEIAMKIFETALENSTSSISAEAMTQVLQGPEVRPLIASVDHLFVESGLIPQGEATPPADLSTGTSSTN